MISKGGSTVEGSISVSLKQSVSFGIEKTLSFYEVKDVYVGLDVTGTIDAEVEIYVVAGLRLV